MIAASEPVEFVPHGRSVLARHPGNVHLETRGADNSLLYKLTNIALDDSFIDGKEDREEEWWCVRGVFENNAADFKEDDDELVKDTKDDLTESRPQSRLKNEFNISIKSEILSSSKRCEDPPSKAGSVNLSSNISKKFNLTSARNTPVAKPATLSSKTVCTYEEELYVKGCTVVWSKGSLSSPATRFTPAEHRQTIACYTSESPVKHAIFCNFHINVNDSMLLDALNSQIGDLRENIKIDDDFTENMPKEVMPSILIVDNTSMKAFTADGREYLTSLPFQIKKAWPMKYGVLLEKDATNLVHNSLLSSSLLKLNESASKSRTNLFHNNSRFRMDSVLSLEDVQLPTCFSLIHPLNDVAPIIMKSSTYGLQYFCDGDLKIVFVSADPSIVLLYDKKTGVHSLWKIRKSTREECLQICPNNNVSTTMLSQSIMGSSFSCFSNTGPRNLAKNSSFVPASANSPNAKTNVTPAKSRPDSPLATAFLQQGLSPHTSLGQASSTSMLAQTLQQNPPSLPIYPEVCLDHIWSDSLPQHRDIESRTPKAFLHTDLVGNDYLCYITGLCGATKLQMMKLQKTHYHGQSRKDKLIIGAVSSLQVKDAVVLDNLKMIALIDDTGNIVLQSGNSILGKVHVGGVLARLIDSPYSKRTFTSPFPRRSSLLPSRSNDVSVFDDPALHLLSPVPHSSHDRKNALGLQGLRDPVGNKVTLQFDKGSYFRITLPEVTNSSLVQRCLNALRAVLQKDVTMQIISKWYGTRNAPGTQDLTPEQEWNMFASLLLAMIGYDVDRMAPNQKNDAPTEPQIATKKQRTSSDGTQDDWEFMLQSTIHKTLGTSLPRVLNLTPQDVTVDRNGAQQKMASDDSRFNKNAPLFSYAIQILFSFHLVYEDTKLNTLLCEDLKFLSGFLYQIAKDLRLANYVNHYWKDFPVDLSLDVSDSDSLLSGEDFKKLTQPSYFTFDPPNVFQYFDSILRNDVMSDSFPYLHEVNEMTKNLVEIVGFVARGVEGAVQHIARSESLASSTPRPRQSPPHLDVHSQHIHTAQMIVDRGIGQREIDCLPPAIALLLLNALNRCKESPPLNWTPEAYRLIMREDLAQQADAAAKIIDANDYLEVLAFDVLERETAYTQCRHLDSVLVKSRIGDFESYTGLEHLDTKVHKLLYPRDLRMLEVVNLLQSAVPVVINLTQRPEVSDHDFIEEQEKHLLAISTRTMALPIARGMVTLRTIPCVPTESLKLPQLCTSGRGPPPRSNAIELTDAHCAQWPAFHNGVAAGLALVPMSGANIHASWVVYNKPKGAMDMSTEHAGFLMALGLNGHLKDMPFMQIYEYLVRCQDMISTGLLLGLAATYRGTMDVQATKMMSIHLEPLLPVTSLELDIQQNVLVAALMGIGLIYQGTMHTHYAEVLANEIGHPPEAAEAERAVEREGYALAAGLALGLVCAGSHRTAPPHLAHHLRHYVLGGATGAWPLTSSQKEKYKQGSFAIREGSTVNLDVTAPGATLALGLLYLKSNNSTVAEWLAPPATHYLLDYVRPDLLMLRIIARGLILWEGVEPCVEWVEAQVPDFIKLHCSAKPSDEYVDYEAMNQAYCNIVAGACFCIGLRFAGSGDEDARDCLMRYVNKFINIGGKTICDLAGKSTVESCLSVMLLSAAMVMSGRGDIVVLRACRRLRQRIASPDKATPTNSQPITHAGQMAVHMSIGLLFLGGGRCTLGTGTMAVAAMLAAFFPKFPTHTADNRYHLQAFRHLYVLACEGRLLIPRDINTGRLSFAHVTCVSVDGSTVTELAPCLLPELATLREVRVDDPRYWPIVFQKDRNWEQLEKFLELSWCVDIKQRAGCLSYLEDPQGFHTLLAQTLTLDQTKIWSATANSINSFTSDERIRNLTRHYLKYKRFQDDESENLCQDCNFLRLKKTKEGPHLSAYVGASCACNKYGPEERQLLQSLSIMTYECVVKDLLCVLPVLISYVKLLTSFKTNPSVYHIWQVKLLTSGMENFNRRHENMDIEPPISNEFVVSIRQKVLHFADAWQSRVLPYLKNYLGLPVSHGDTMRGKDFESVMKMLSAFVVFYELPKDILKNTSAEGVDKLKMLLDISNVNLGVDAFVKLSEILSETR